MKKLLIISMSLLLASGCASTSHHMAKKDYSFPSIETTPAQAQAYIAELKLKKKRFKERQLLASAAAFSDPEQLAMQTKKHKDEFVARCQGIAKGDWATSVQYGQNFLSYDNHVETMKRCFSQEKQANIILDITTAMN